MKKILEIKKLIEELNRASNAYYNTENTIMSDKEFDSKLVELETLEKETGIVMSNSPTQKVGAPVLTKLNKIIHEFKQMLSLEKVHSAEEIIKFANGKELIAMIKLDGLSVRLTYHHGVLSKAETRGNGIEGSDITIHVKHFKNVPLVINNKSGSYVVDGEAIITDDDFEAINVALPEGVEKFKNSRNLASGTLALLDTSLVKKRHLRFVLWDVIVGSNCDNFNDKLLEAADLGFECVPWTNLYIKRNVKESDILNINEVMFKTSKEFGYPCDGVVWKLNDIAYGESLGQTSHHFCNAVAFKEKQDTYETTLREIEYTMGKTGSLCPVAIFDPVEIDGTKVSRASVHNISILTDLELSVGDVITVYKANQIIPQISENLSAKGRNKQSGIGQMEYIHIPATCPICGESTEIKKDNETLILMCTNNDCKGKLLGKLEHACSKNALNIEGMSEQTLQFMIDKGWIKSIKDIYIIPFYKEVYQEWINSPGFGKRSVDKLKEAIEKSKNTTLDKFLYAQGINLIGRTASKDISKFCHGDIDVFCEFMNSSKSKEFLNIEGFGEIMYQSLIDWWNKYCIEFLDLKNIFIFSKNTETNQNNNVNLSGKTFVVTGSLNHFNNRDELKELLENLGAKVSGSVSAKTFALICNENTGSSKSKKAIDLGIPIWTEDQLLKYIH